MLKSLIIGNRNFALAPIVASVLLISAATVFATCTENDSDPYGSLLNAEEFNEAVQALPPAALMTPPVQPPLPPSASLDNLPAVSQQGTATPPGLGNPGSCEAQSFGYGLGSYTAARRPDGSSKWPAQAAGELDKRRVFFFLGNVHWVCTMSSRRLGAALSKPLGRIWCAYAGPHSVSAELLLFQHDSTATELP